MKEAEAIHDPIAPLICALPTAHCQLRAAYWLKSYQSRFLVSFKSCNTADFTLIVTL